MFILNGIEPTAICNRAVHFGDGTIEPCVIACYKLPVFHEYDTEWTDGEEEHWNECACGEKTNVAPHADTDSDEKCDTCGCGMPVTDTEPGTDTPDDPTDGKDGLGAGAIALIVIGAVLVVGIGGFAIFWFVIKKKSFTDLIAVFKKNQE
jgi:hypothetical protein